MRNRALIAGLIVATMLGGCKESIFDPRSAGTFRRPAPGLEPPRRDFERSGIQANC